MSAVKSSPSRPRRIPAPSSSATKAAAFIADASWHAPMGRRSHGGPRHVLNASLPPCPWNGGTVERFPGIPRHWAELTVPHPVPLFHGVCLVLRLKGGTAEQSVERPFWHRCAETRGGVPLFHCSTEVRGPRFLAAAA